MRSLVITTISIALLAYLVPQISIVNLSSLVLLGVVIGLLNSIVRPILKMLFLPINLLTLGLFNWLINVALLYLALWLVPGVGLGPITLLGFELNTFGSLVFFAFALSFFNSLIGSFL